MKTVTQLFLILLVSIPGYASELTLKGRLLLQDTKFGWDDNTPAPHSKLKNGYTVGIAMFDDGSLAEKQFVFAQNNREKDGNIVGYTLYTFPNSDSLLMEFKADWDASGMKFEYFSIIEGTGRFEGATGTGTGTGVAGPWYETIMADVILELTLRTP